MKVFFLCAWIGLALTIVLRAQPEDAPVDPFSEAPLISFGQRADAVVNVSYRGGKGGIESLNDGLEPKSSGDDSVPSFSLFPHAGSFEWVEYIFPSARVFEGCEVFWKRGPAAGDKTGSRKDGGLPHFWKVHYQNADGHWLPVEGNPETPALDRWNVCRFAPVLTKGLRLAIQQRSEETVGLYEWKVIPSKAKPVLKAAPAELLLDDVIPLSAKVGYLQYHVNQLYKWDVDRGGRVLLGGLPCHHYLFVHAESEVVFSVPKGYTRFTATGITQSNHPDPTITFQVFADGKSLFQSAILASYPQHEIRIEVDLPPNCRTLSLTTGTAGSMNRDHSIWAEPKLLRVRPNGNTLKPKPLPEAPKVNTFEIKIGPAADEFLVAKRDKPLELNAKRGSVFRIVPGLHDAKKISLELVGNRGCFVRHSNGILWLHERPRNNAVFDSDATFTMIKTDEKHVRLEQGNRRGTFIAVRDDGSIALSNSSSREQTTFLLVPKE